MISYIARRLGLILLTLLISSVLIFIVTQILPGDVAKAVLGRFATPQALHALRVKLGLDRSLPIQYGSWLVHYIQGDWGVSLSTGEPVLNLVAARLRNSGMLALVAFVMYVPLGILLGLLAALRRNRAADQIISITSLAFIGLPEFVTGVGAGRRRAQAWAIRPARMKRPPGRALEERENFMVRREIGNRERSGGFRGR